MKIKAGVRVPGLRPEILLAVMIADSVYQMHRVELVVTSFLEGNHSANSLHYAGMAVDLRTFNIPDGLTATIYGAIKDRLTDDYDIILEKDHIHIECQPMRWEV